MVARFAVSGNPDEPERLSTVGSGKPAEVVDERTANTGKTGPGGDAGHARGVDPAADDLGDNDDIARDALVQAQRITGTSPSGLRPGRRRRRRGPSPGFTGAGPDPHDPQPLGRLLDGLVDERGWERPLAEARLFADWASIVGADIAAHCAPVSLDNGELRIQAASTAWATQLRLMASALLASLARQLGPQVVRKVFITGPTGPNWKNGAWSVRGARGPRDTYG
jgi:predicted nucleic acid-binding Zn ribbon protein